MPPRTALDSAVANVSVLATILLGLAAGAMLAQAAVLIPSWRALPAESFLQWYAANAARLFDFYGPLEIASAAFAGAAAALHAYRRSAGARSFVVATVLAIAILVMFPLYFQDVNAAFAAGTIDVARVPDELVRYAVWQWMRTVIGVVAFGAAVLGVRT